MTRRVALIEANPLLLWALVHLLGAENGVRVVSALRGPSGLAQILERERPHLVVLDPGLDALARIRLIPALLKRDPTLAVLLFARQRDLVHLSHAARVGARGCVLKSDSPGRIVDAVRAVLRGERWVGQPEGGGGDAFTRRAPVSHDLVAVQPLSAREMEVFRLIGDGLAPRHIALSLGLSVSTVEVHRQQIRRKLKLENSARLTRFAVAWSRDGRELASPDGDTRR
ncbi:MAG: response regulator transcription factor [Gemmatimonadota bacterium]|nr:response regulator transcription factor [Gemmatimonadota bacterium]